MENTNIKEVKKETQVEVKLMDFSKKSLKIENYVKKDDKMAKLITTSFDELSQEDLKKLTLCKAKVEHLVTERYNRQGKKEVSERDILSIKLCSGLIINRRLDDLDMNLIKELCPQIIVKSGCKAEVSIPVKLITYIDKNGRRGYRYIAYVCPSVYIKNFFIDKQLTSIAVANLQTENKLYFYDVDQIVMNSLVENQDVEVDEDF